MSEDVRIPADIICLYEEQVAKGDVDLLQATTEAVDALAQFGQKRGGFSERGASEVYQRHWYTRFAAAITEYLTKPDTVLTINGLRQICVRKGSIVSIFQASGYGNMQHLIRKMTYEEAGERRVSLAKGALLLATLGLDDLTDPLRDAAFLQPPQILLELTLGWLTQRSILTKRGEENRTFVISEAQRIVAAAIKDAHIVQVIQAWMYCSYAETPTKHDLKLALNELLRNRMKTANISPRPVTHKLSSTPKMLVLHERFNANHAMFRCYAPSIRHLKSHFEVIAIGEHKNIDEASNDLFHRVEVMEEKIPPISELVRTIESERPDVIYFPSLGMSHWTVMLAQLRLAPLQLMTYGHPATPKLSTIDYGYINEIRGDIGALHDEKVILGPSLFAFDQHSELPEQLPELVAPSEREVRVAVNSKVMKLNYRLLDICKRLEAAAEVPLRFSFFPGERFMLNDGLTAAIKSMLPTAEVVPYTTYDNFLRRMCMADLALAAFPFGNTNSTVDTCLLGLPTVVHHGSEIPAQTDRLVIETAGLSNDLVCDSDDDYFNRALDLINNPEKRAAMLNGLTREQIRENLFGAVPKDTDHVMAEVFFSLYKNHASLRNANNQVLHYRDLQAAL